MAGLEGLLRVCDWDWEFETTWEVEEEDEAGGVAYLISLDPQALQSLRVSTELLRHWLVYLAPQSLQFLATRSMLCPALRATGTPGLFFNKVKEAVSGVGAGEDFGGISPRSTAVGRKTEVGVIRVTRGVAAANRVPSAANAAEDDAYWT